MVVFTCQKCNSTLKKNAVEKHFSCRPFFLTCIDCLKDFKGNEYDAHTSCITEAEKYGGGKAVVKPQGVKQEKWAETVQEILTKLSENPKYNKLCGPLKQASNIPRNRNKFHNFVRSGYPKLYNAAIVNEIFNHLEEAKVNNRNESNSNIIQSNSGAEETPENDSNSLKKKKKKDKKENQIENSEKRDESNSKKKDKNNKKKRTLTESSDNHNTQNGNNVKKIKHEKKNKNKHTSDDSDVGEDVNDYQNKENDEELNENGVNHEELNENGVNKSLNEETTCEETNGLKLSKKERKKLKKLQKYNAEVAEILTAQPEEDSTNVEQEDNVEKKKKKKKQKAETMDVEKEYSADPSDKQKHEKNDTEEDIAGKEVKLNDTLLSEQDIPVETGKKFRWGQIIKQILENSSGKELPLKKLRKKVINEYMAQKGDDTPYEKLLGTFNKKINSTEGVKVLKDKAQLIST